MNGMGKIGSGHPGLAGWLGEAFGGAELQWHGPRRLVYELM